LAVEAKDIEDLKKLKSKLEQTLAIAKRIDRLIKSKSKKGIKLSDEEKEWVSVLRHNTVKDISSTDLIDRNRHNIQSHPLRIQRITAYIKAFEARIAGREAPDLISEALDQFYDTDHSNGFGGGLPEVLAEIARQQAAQRLADLRNKKIGTHDQTIENYFALLLEDVYIYGTNSEKTPAAILGRQAHWSHHHKLGYPFPPEILEDPHGIRQGDAFGALVDFGATIITDKRLRKKFRLNPDEEYDRNYFEAWKRATVASDRFLKGDSQAAYDYLEDMLRPIQKQWQASIHGEGFLTATQKKLLKTSKLFNDPRENTDVIQKQISDWILHWVLPGFSGKLDFMPVAMMVQLASSQPKLFLDEIRPFMRNFLRKSDLDALQFIGEVLLPSLRDKPKLLETAFHSFLQNGIHPEWALFTLYSLKDKPKLQMSLGLAYMRVANEDTLQATETMMNLNSDWQEALKPLREIYLKRKEELSSSSIIFKISRDPQYDPESAPTQNKCREAIKEKKTT